MLLSKAESATMFCVLSGMTNRQIAEFLGVSMGCVGNRLASVQRKLGLLDKRQIAVYLLTGYHPSGEVS